MLLNKSSILCLAEALLLPVSVSQLNQREEHNADTLSSVSLSLSVSPGWVLARKATRTSSGTAAVPAILPGCASTWASPAGSCTPAVTPTWSLWPSSSPRSASSAQVWHKISEPGVDVMCACAVLISLRARSRTFALQREASDDQTRAGRRIWVSFEGWLSLLLDIISERLWSGSKTRCGEKQSIYQNRDSFLPPGWNLVVEEVGRLQGERGRERERGQMKGKLVKIVRHLRFRVRLSNVDLLLTSPEMKAAVNLWRALGAQQRMEMNLLYESLAREQTSRCQSISGVSPH